MTNDTTLDWSRALQQSAEWRLLGMLFERPHGAWLDELESIAREVTAQDLRVASSAASGTSEGFHLAFVGPGGPVSPREIAYRAARDPGQVLAELAAFYSAFAYQPRREDPLDHVAVEAGFVAFMRLKEAYAIASEDVTRAALTAEATERFLREHLAAFAPVLARRLEEHAAGHLALAARALALRLEPYAPQAAEPSLPMCDEIADCSLTCGLEGSRDAAQ